LFEKFIALLRPYAQKRVFFAYISRAIILLRRTVFRRRHRNGLIAKRAKPALNKREGVDGKYFLPESLSLSISVLDASDNIILCVILPRSESAASSPKTYLPSFFPVKFPVFPVSRKTRHYFRKHLFRSAKQLMIDKVAVFDICAHFRKDAQRRGLFPFRSRPLAY
jgi:hypothetical protein